MKIEQTYNNLVAELQRLFHLTSIRRLLEWDEMAIMPAGGAEQRAQQRATLCTIIHKAATDPKIDHWLQELEAYQDELTPEQWTVVRESRRSYNLKRHLPATFIAKRSKAQSAAHSAWLNARKQNDFSLFAPYLATNIAITKEEASLQGYNDNPYDYCLDQFDPGLTTSTVRELFTELQQALIPLRRKILESDWGQPVPLLGRFAETKQEAFIKKVLEKMHFDFNHGRLDKSVHPFCGGIFADTRITTRYSLQTPFEALLASIHETGHALYRQGLDKTNYGTPLAEPIGTAFDESQSRLWENQVGRSAAFWQYWEQPLRKTFPKPLEGLSSQDLLRVINTVEKHPLRVHADEVSYNLHIMLRFTLEQDIINNDLPTQDLPHRWNELTQEYLDQTPTSDLEGVLQDIHWALGFIGYFPSYSIGNMIAAQLWETLQEQLPHLQQDITVANYRPLLDWLRHNIHEQGRRYSTQELVLKLTNKALSPQPLIKYLEHKFLPSVG